MALGTAQLHALTRHDALSLVRDGNIEEIDRVFAAEYDRFVAGEIAGRDFHYPYNLFYTLEPRVLEVVEDWRRQMPDSAFAMIADADQKSHLAAILRGSEPIGLVSEKGYAQAWQLWSEARDLYAQALDMVPQHTRAANGLQDVALYLGDNTAALRGKRILATYGSQVSLLLTQLYESTPQWGGSVAKMRRLCDTIAPKIEEITVAACHARGTLMLWDSSQEERDAAVEVLRREDAHGNRFIIARELLNTGKAEEALAIYDAEDATVPLALIPVFAQELNNYALQERLADRRLAVNPLHPRYLALKSESQGRRRDYAGAAESIEKAMIYGETLHEVRRWRLAWMMQDRRHHEILGEIEDALVDTSFHPIIMDSALEKLVWDDQEKFRYQADGSEHSRFQCRRLRILSGAFNSCGLHPNRDHTLGCSNATLQRALEIIGEIGIENCKDLSPLVPIE